MSNGSKISTKIFWDRTFKSFVLLGVPLLGWLYFSQHTGKSMGRTEIIVPFKVEMAPSLAGVETATKGGPLVSLNWASNKVSVVSFWATWCPPCVEELPAMAELAGRLENAGVKFYFVSIDDNWPKVEKFLSDNVIEIPKASLFLDPGSKVANKWNSFKFPETYVVDRQGWLIEKIVGFQDWTRPSVFSYFENLARSYTVSMTINSQKRPSSSFRRLAQKLALLALPMAMADEKKPAAMTMIHADDKKALAKLQANVETANKNVQKLEAAIRDDERSLREVKIRVERQERDKEEIQSQYNKVTDSLNEVEKVRKKNEDSLASEKKEKDRVAKEIASLQSKQKDLEKELEKTRDAIVLTNQMLSTRMQNIESFDKALSSSKDELKSLHDREKKVAQNLKDSSKEIAGLRSDYGNREGKMSSLKADLAKWEEALSKEKQKLVEFEKLLK